MKRLIIALMLLSMSTPTLAATRTNTSYQRGYEKGYQDGYEAGYTAALAEMEQTRSMPEEEYYVLNINSHKIHRSDCSSVNDISDRNRKDFHGSYDELLEYLDEQYPTANYSNCGRCHPERKE